MKEKGNPKGKKGQYDTNIITRRLRLLVFVFAPLYLFTVGISLYISLHMKAQTVQYLVNTVELYNMEIDETVARINRRMGQLLVGNTEESKAVSSNAHILSTSGNEVDKLQAVRELQNIFYELSMEYGSSYNFFIYIPSSKYFVRGSVAVQPERVYRAFSNVIEQMIETDRVELNSGVQFWKSFSVEEHGSCIMKLYRRDDVFLGCWIPADDLIQPLENMDFGRGGFAVLTDEQENYLTGQAMVEDYGLRMKEVTHSRYQVDSGFLTNHLVIERKLNNAPFYVKLLIAEYGIFDKIMVLQLLLLLLALGMFAALLGSSYVLIRQVLRPVRKFSQNLEKLRTGGEQVETMSHNEMAELERVNVEFRRLFRKIQGLEVELYERQLDQQNVELNYLKLQIRPHFYLNCLNFIYNMIDLGDADNAQKMAVVTADYLRYLFKNGMDFVPVEEELDHVGSYLAILQMRYRSALDYWIEQDDETKGAKVPPMIIQTFVENSVKHSVDLDRPVSISVAVCLNTVNGEERLMILVSDNGPGFSEAVLADLQQRSATGAELRAGVGIENSLRRLEYYYGGQASVRFSNGLHRGAIVHIELPVQPHPKYVATPAGGGRAHDDIDG